MEPATRKKVGRAFTFRGLGSVIKETFSEWSADKVPRLGAALAFYTLFSIAPLVIIFITITGLVFDDAQAQVLTQIKSLLGEKGSEAIQSMIEAARKPAESILSTILGFAALIFGAIGVFMQLKDAMNTVWNIKPPAKGGLWAFLRKYFLSFTMVLGIGFMLLVSLLLSAGLAIVGEFFSGYLPEMEVLMKVLSVVVSFSIVTVLFAVMFKFLPDTKIAWRDVWLGAVLTAFLFVLGKVGLGIYLGRAGVASAYGAAGSLVLVLLWVYYSSQILFFGAEFTQVFSRVHGSRKETHPITKKQTAKDKLIARIERDRRDLAWKAKTFGLGATSNEKAGKTAWRKNL